MLDKSRNYFLIYPTEGPMTPCFIKCFCIQSRVFTYFTISIDKTYFQGVYTITVFIQSVHQIHFCIVFNKINKFRGGKTVKTSQSSFIVNSSDGSQTRAYCLTSSHNFNAVTVRFYIMKLELNIHLL